LSSAFSDCHRLAVLRSSTPYGPRRVSGANFPCCTSTLLKHPGDDPFQLTIQQAELDHVHGSRIGSASLAENYVGLPLELPEVQGLTKAI
jgi:hypothetical protein